MDSSRGLVSQAFEGTTVNSRYNEPPYNDNLDIAIFSLPALIFPYKSANLSILAISLEFSKISLYQINTEPMRCLATQSPSLNEGLSGPGIFTNIHDLVKNNVLSGSTSSSIIE